MAVDAGGSFAPALSNPLAVDAGADIGGSPRVAGAASFCQVGEMERRGGIGGRLQSVGIVTVVASGCGGVAGLECQAMHAFGVRFSEARVTGGTLYGFGR